jgi:hypothetical protein
MDDWQSSRFGNGPRTLHFPTKKALFIRRGLSSSYLSDKLLCLQDLAPYQALLDGCWTSLGLFPPSLLIRVHLLLLCVFFANFLFNYNV